MFGINIYATVCEIPGPVDLACIAVPAPQVHAALYDCMKKGVPWAQILSAGFAESDDNGKRLEKELGYFTQNGLRIIGPNCFGVHCPECGLTILPGGGFSRAPGPVAFIGQSGGLAVDLGYSSSGLNIGWRRMVSFGNACDVGAAELIEHFGSDPGTKVIAAYIEGVKDGRAFFEAVRRASKIKPVVIWKGGLTESGARAVMSHTGSLGGQSAIWESVFRQINAVSVWGQEEMLDVIVAFLNIGEFSGRGVCVAGGGGALGVAASDSADRVGMCLPPFSEKSRAAMEALMPPPGNSFNNPADVGNPMIAAPMLEQLMDIAAQDPAIDIIMLIQILHHMACITKQQMDLPKELPLKSIAQHKAMAEVCAKVQERSGKPVLQILPPISSEEEKMELEGLVREARRVSHEAGVATYPSLERALAAVSRVSAYYRRRAVST